MANDRRDRLPDLLWNTFNWGPRGHFNWVPPTERKRQDELLGRGCFDAGWHEKALHNYEGMCSVSEGVLRFSEGQHEGAQQFRCVPGRARLGRRPIVDDPQRSKGGLRRRLLVQCGDRVIELRVPNRIAKQVLDLLNEGPPAEPTSDGSGPS